MNVKKIAAATTLVGALGLASVVLGAGLANAQPPIPPPGPQPGPVHSVIAPPAVLPWYLTDHSGPPGVPGIGAPGGPHAGP